MYAILYLFLPCENISKISLKIRVKDEKWGEASYISSLHSAIKKKNNNWKFPNCDYNFGSFLLRF